MTPADLARRTDLEYLVETLRVAERLLTSVRKPSLLNRIRAIRGELEQEAEHALRHLDTNVLR